MGEPSRSLRRGHVVAIATVAALVAGIVAPDLAEARRRDSVEILSTAVVVTVAGTSGGAVTICADEKSTFEVTVEEQVTYRWTNDPPGATHTSRRPPPGRTTVDVSSADPAASVSPATAVIRPPRTSVSFDITGEDPGNATVSIVVGRSTIVRVLVTVEECAYKFSTHSHWYFGVGFKPDTFAHLSDLQLRRVRPNTYIGTGNLRNSGVGTPVGGCTPQITVPDTQVIVRAEIVQGQYRPEVKLNVQYSPVPAGMTVTCPGVPQKGTSSDTAMIQVIDTNMKAWEFDSKHVPGHVGESKLGSATSNTFLVLDVIRP